MDFYHLYPTEFQDLLNKDYSSDSYIGQGNPSSKILLIGKECANSNDDCLFIKNAEKWKTKSPENIENWVELPSFMPEKYHPRRPYLGQRFVTIRNNNKGTFVTWKAYQKFINLLLPENLQVKPGQQLNFYDYCFMTELSSNCMSKSKKNEKTKDSIKQRLSDIGILSHPFFKTFPVVILGVYRYIDWYKEIPIIKNFDGGIMNYTYKGIIVSEDEYSQFDEKFKKEHPLYRANNTLKKGEFFNVHVSADDKHILIHTNHFIDHRYPRSEDWMKSLADLIESFLK